MSAETTKHFILLSTLISWVFGYVLYQKTKHAKAATMSKSAVIHKKSFMVFVGGISMTQILQVIGVFGYMRPETSVPDLFYVFYAITTFLLILLAVTPATKGLSLKVHYWSAHIMAYILLVLSGLLFVNAADHSGRDDVSGFGIALGVLLTIALAGIVTWRSVPDRSAKQLLHAQQLFFVCFQLILLTRIYL